MQIMPMNATRQLVADRRTDLAAAAHRGGLRRRFSRAAGAQPTRLDPGVIDLTSLELAGEPTPAVILPASPAAGAVRIDKVA